MATAEIDVTVFKPHSVRAAATSKAKLNNACTSDIMRAAGWTSAATFAKYYCKSMVDWDSAMSSGGQEVT